MAYQDISGRKGGKGGGGGKSFKEAPNNLRSKSTARIVGIISAGPIKGLVDGERSIFFDTTPLQDNNGGYLFQGVTWEMRHGYPDQDHMPGFASVEKEVSVAQNLKKDNPIVRTIDDPDVDAVRIKLGIEGLHYTNQDDNYMGGATVDFAVDVSEAGGPFVEKLAWRISGKTVSVYEESRRVELAKGKQPWKVRVRRITADSTSSLLQNKSVYTTYTEIIDAKLTYPDTAIMGLQVDAQLFGDNLQKPFVEVYGRIVQIPANYDPVSREYTGFWDGTFKRDWTDNPAWVFYDLLTDPDIGLGQYVAQEYVDVWSLYAIAKYCDELVDDGFGGKEPRFTYNNIIADQKEAYEALLLLAGMFRGMLYWGPGTVMLVQDAPAEPGFHVTPANLVTEGAGDPPVNYEGTAFSARHSVAMVTWMNPEENYAATIETYEDPELVAELGWRPIDILETGCTSQGQAARKARYIIDTEKNATQTVSFRQSLEGGFASPGEVAMLSDPSFAGARTGGRLIEATSQKLRMDAAFTFLETEEYRFWLSMPDGTGLEVPVHNPARETDTVYAKDIIADIPPAGTVFAILATNLEPQQFRILGVEEQEKNIYAFIGLEHDPTKYDRIEKGLQLEKASTTLLSTGPLAAPTNLKATEILYLAGGITPRSKAVLSWTPADDPRVIRYGVQVVRPGEDAEAWFSMGQADGVSMDILDTEPGHWRFAVRSFDGLGRFSAWAYLDVDLIGLYAPPADVVPFRVEMSGGMAILTWEKVKDLDLSHYEIRFSPVLAGATWANSSVLVESLPGNLVSFAIPARVGSYLIKAIDIVGVESVNASMVVSNASSLEDLNVIEVLVEDTAFSGGKENINFTLEPLGMGLASHPESNYFDCADYFEHPDYFLRKRGLAPRGVYTFSNAPFDLGGVFACKVSSHLLLAVLTYNHSYFDRASFFGAANYFNEPTAGYGAWVEIRCTNSDPDRARYASAEEWEGIWTPWTALHTGEYSGRGFDFRCVLETDHFATTPVVRELSVEIDMPDRIVDDNDLIVPASPEGFCVVYSPPFLRNPSLAFSFQDMLPGDDYAFLQKDRYGFCLMVKDSNGLPVTRTMDYIAKGYGYDRS